MALKLLRATAINLFVVASGLSNLSFSQTTVCDPILVERGKGLSLGYRLRGDACEGTLSEDVSGTADIRLVGFTSFLDDRELNLPATVPITWKALPGTRVTLHAAQTRPRQLYRLDREAGSGSGAYNWPTSTAAQAHLSLRQLAFLGEVTESAGGAARTVFIPLTVGQPAQNAHATYRLSFLPKVSLTGFAVTLVAIDENGKAHGKGVSLPFPNSRLSPNTEFLLPLDPKDFPSAGLVRMNFSAGEGSRSGQLYLRLLDHP